MQTLRSNNGIILQVIGTPKELDLMSVQSPWEPMVPVRVVAVVGRNDDWAAYVDVDTKSSDSVAIGGVKLTYEQAVRLFPVLNPDRWRR